MIPPLILAAFAWSQARAELVVRYGVLFGNIGSAASVEVNGFPFNVGGPGAQQSNSEQLNRFLKQGGNLIRAVFTDQDFPPDPDEEDPLPNQFRVLIETFTPGDEEEVEFLRYDRTFGFSKDTPGAGLEVTEIAVPGVWQAELRSTIPPLHRSRVQVDRDQRLLSGTTVQEAGPYEIFISFALDDFPIAGLPWQQPYTAPNAAEIAAMKAMIVDLRSAFVAKDVAQINTLLAPKLQRMADSLGLPLQEISDALITSYQQTVFGVAGIVFVPINPDDLLFEQVGDLNLIEAKLGEANPIRAESADFLFEMRLFFSNVDGEWTLVE